MPFVPEPEGPLCDADPLARALARLRPAPAGIDGSRLLFLAGQAARDRAVAFWRRAFLGQCVVLVAVGCVATLHLTRLDALEAPQQTAAPAGRADRPAPRAPADPTVDQGPAAPPGPEPAPPPRPAPDYPPVGPLLTQQTDPSGDALAEYLRVRREVLTAGLGLLPDAKPRRSAPVSPTELERSLQLPPGVLTAPYRLAPPKPPADPSPE